jgi:C_GCAxxG_C_C family probable redox protein
MKKVDNALLNFKDGLNCSQCVLLAFSDELGLEKNLSVKIASGFGGGMCQGEICGAVTGAVIALNLKYGNDKAEDNEAKEKIYQAIRLFSERFENINGSIICKDLIGIDLKQKENKILARKRGIFKEKCPEFIEDSIAILENLILNDPF